MEKSDRLSIEVLCNLSESGWSLGVRPKYRSTKRSIEVPKWRLKFRSAIRSTGVRKSRSAFSPLIHSLLLMTSHGTDEDHWCNSAFLRQEVHTDFSYFGIPCHRLPRFIDKEVTFFKIREKIRSITADNASNIVNAVYATGLGTHLSCMGHNLSLIVKNNFIPTEKK